MTARLRLRVAAIAGAVALSGAFAWVLLRFPPELYAFYPRCPVYAAFGLLCPGCGGTRALAALLHGQVGGALRWNALVTVAVLVGLPASGVYAAAARRWSAVRGSVARFQVSLAALFGTAAVLFTVWRNLRG